MSVNYVAKIKELNGPKVHIKDKDNVNRLINEIVQEGAKKLQIVSDFDRTITKQHENGKKHLSSFGLFSLCPSLPPEYLENEKRITAKYYPMEVDPTIPPPEKRKLMEEWWEQTKDALVGLKISQKEIDDTVAKLGPALRNGTPELFNDLNKADIPVLVFSAGLGDVVVSVLQHFNVLLPNVKVISNFLQYDDKGVIQGFKGTLIHVLNKNEYALKGTEYYDLVKDRDNVVLMGDNLGDAAMADGINHANAVLKIGFLFEHVTESLPSFMETFDIVLEDDQTMEIVQAILKELP